MIIRVEIKSGDDWVELTGDNVVGTLTRDVIKTGTYPTGEDKLAYRTYTYEEPQLPEDSEDYRITRLAFLDRFTEDEYVTLDLASIDDPNAGAEARTNQAKIRRYLKKVEAANYIDLSRQDTIDGVNVLALLGILTPERAGSILTDPINQEERP